MSGALDGGSLVARGIAWPSSDYFTVASSGTTVISGVISGGRSNRIISFQNPSGEAVAWIDSEGNYHKASDAAAAMVPSERELQAMYVKGVIASLPVPARHEFSTAAVGLGVLCVLVVSSLMSAWVVGWLPDWRWIAAKLLTRPLRRLSKWLDRGPRGTEATALRFRRDLNRTIEQLESERRGG